MVTSASCNRCGVFCPLLTNYFHLQNAKVGRLETNTC